MPKGLILAAVLLRVEAPLSVVILMPRDDELPAGPVGDIFLLFPNFADSIADRLFHAVPTPILAQIVRRNFLFCLALCNFLLFGLFLHGKRLLLLFLCNRFLPSILYFVLLDVRLLGLYSLAEPLDSLIIFPQAFARGAILLHLRSLAMSPVCLPETDVLQPICKSLRTIPVVLSLCPLTRIHPAVRVDHCALPVVHAIKPLAIVLVLAWITLQADAVLLAANKLSFV